METGAGPLWPSWEAIPSRRWEIVRTFNIRGLPLPDRKLSPNNKTKMVHWGTRAKLVRDHRETVATLTMAQLPVEARAAKIERALVQMIVYHPSEGFSMDPDNALAWQKSTLDGIADAGVLGDDRNLFHFPIIQRVGEPWPSSGPSAGYGHGLAGAIETLDVEIVETSLQEVRMSEWIMAWERDVGFDV